MYAAVGDKNRYLTVKRVIMMVGVVLQVIQMPILFLISMMISLILATTGRAVYMMPTIHGMLISTMGMCTTTLRPMICTFGASVRDYNLDI